MLCLSTLVSHSGSLLHIGQTFFNDTWNDDVYNTSPYTSNKNDRMSNDQDSILSTATQNGYNAYTRWFFLFFFSTRAGRLTRLSA